MSVMWTKEQQSVIDLQGRNILVSAAAGSGKTAVLVERIITMLTRETDPVDVDALLIVTFTEAAAAEMKERIRNAIEKKLEECPEDERLQRQATLIHNAWIMTIHSFCLAVIREHFHKIDLDPGFRIGEEGELRLMKQDVLEQVLEEWYAEGSQDFLDFVESYAGGRDDRKLEDLVLKLYEFSRSYPDSEQWLESCVESYRVSSKEELEQTAYFHTMQKNVKHYMESARQVQKEAVDICLESDGPYMYEDMLEDDLRIIRQFEEANGYEDYCKAAAKLPWKRLAPNKDKTVSVQKAEQVKALREELKDTVKTVAEQYFKDPLSDVLEGLALCRPMMEVLVSLTGQFARAFEETKRSQNMIDFDDMEQYALRILTQKTPEGLVPSKIAEEYQEQFREVMIDEYQDSNLIQEAILTSVSGVSKGIYNVFMVGDVKQSIYRFRLSRPELFMEKFDTYRLYEGKGSDSLQQRIDLHRNFRSRKEVLKSVNFLCGQLMDKPLGGVVYDEKAALYPGASYPALEGTETEVLLVDAHMEENLQVLEEEGERLSERRLEARAAARRIKELLQEQQVTEKDGTLRPVRYSDIVILTRSVKGWSDVFSEVLEEEGIPVCAGTKEGYFETREIGVLLDYLRVLNNQKQDIPLAAVLASYFGNLSDEELAEIKSAYPEKRFYEAVFLYRKEGSEECIRQKLDGCLGQLDAFREKVPYTSMHELLWKILQETGYGDYVAALPGGEQRKANVDMLLEKAMVFEGTSYKGLFHFVRYIEQMKKYNVDYGEASLTDEQSDVVRLMSIHKSKGLEFPVVIVAGMGKWFNLQDARGSVLIHAGLGVGLDAVDLERRTKTPSFLKKVMQKEEVLESLGEELRVFYVALTRAKEKLILLGAVKDPWGRLESYDGLKKQKEKVLSFGRLSGASSYMSWLLPALARRKDEDAIQIRVMDLEELTAAEVEEELSNAFTKQALLDLDIEETYDEDMRKNLEAQFRYKYPYADMEGRKLKFTVSELKKREHLLEQQEEETGELLYQEPEVVPLLPGFRKGEEMLTGASRGSAYHRVLELLDFTRDYSMDSLKAAVHDMETTGRISGDMAECIRIEDLAAFVQCESGQRMKAAARNGKLFKEQPFVLGVDMQEIYPDAEGKETILIQGIIDVYFEEEGELVVLDYKTDQVKTADQLREKYHAQLEYYAKALEQLTGKRVKEQLIYSVTLKEEIRNDRRENADEKM